MLQIDWEANPPVRRFREKRKDQSERESGDDPDREHNERFWKRRGDRRRRLSRTVISENVSLLFSFASSAAFSRALSCSARKLRRAAVGAAGRAGLEPRSMTSALALARPRAKRSGFASSRRALSDAGAFTAASPIGLRTEARLACWAIIFGLFGPRTPLAAAISASSVVSFSFKPARIWRSGSAGSFDRSVEPVVRRLCIAVSAALALDNPGLIAMYWLVSRSPPVAKGSPNWPWLGRLEAPRAPRPAPYAIRRVAEQTTARFGRPQPPSPPPNRRLSPRETIGDQRRLVRVA